MLLVDEKLTKKFFIEVIPELKETECLLLMLSARKKYCTELARSEEILRREVIREKKWEVFLRKVKRLSYTEGLYVDKNGNPIPEHAFSIYVVLNPKDAVRAWFTLQKEISDLTYQYVKGDRDALRQLKRIDIRWFSALHRTNSRKLYWIVDIDKKDKKLLRYVLDIVEPAWISETRGGYHLILPANKENAVIFTEKEFRRPEIEVKKEPMTPLVGTLQGGHLVKNIESI